MPTLANITVKKYDNVTDIIYTGIEPGGGGNWAKYRQDAGSTLPFAGRPQFWFRATESKTGIKRVECQYFYPYTYTDSATSQVVIAPQSVTFKNGVFTVPQGLPLDLIGQATSQCANLMASALIRQATFEGTNLT